MCLFLKGLSRTFAPIRSVQTWSHLSLHSLPLFSPAPHPASFRQLPEITILEQLVPISDVLSFLQAWRGREDSFITAIYYSLILWSSSAGREANHKSRILLSPLVLRKTIDPQYTSHHWGKHKWAQMFTHFFTDYIPLLFYLLLAQGSAWWGKFCAKHGMALSEFCIGSQGVSI